MKNSLQTDSISSHVFTTKLSQSRQVACTQVTAYVLMREGSITLFLKSDEK